MHNEERKPISYVFTVLASCFGKPSKSVWSVIMSDDVQIPFKENVKRIWGIDIPSEFNADNEYEEIQHFYQQYMMPGNLRTTPPVESIYKPWTTDGTCTLPFARSKGYLLGDSAHHILYLLDMLEIKLPEEYSDMPDHLAILLELLSFLYQYSSEDFILDYLEHHFDWLADYEKEIADLDSSSSYYLLLTRLLAQIVEQERDRLKLSVGSVNYV